MNRIRANLCFRLKIFRGKNEKKSRKNRERCLQFGAYNFGTEPNFSRKKTFHDKNGQNYACPIAF